MKGMHEEEHIAADFGANELGLPINEKEGMALLRVLEIYTRDHAQEVQGKLLVMDVDNEAVVTIFEKGGGSSRNLFLTNICKRLFWLQIQRECAFKLRWVPSAENVIDAITRQPVENDLRLATKVFLRLNRVFGPFDVDLIASSGNVQIDSEGRRLPFFLSV